MSRIALKIRKLLKILVRPGLAKALLHSGVAGGVEHTVVLSQIEGCHTVVDIGANRGQFALAVREILPDTNIFSFEPLPEPAAIFARVFADDSRARLFQSAIGTEAGESIIHVSGRDDSSSLLPITSRQNQLFPGTGETGTMTITVGRLSHYLSETDIPGPALLKLDVQGYELQALKGCEELLHCFEWVYAECSFVELYEGQALAPEVIDWLREHGFNLVGKYNVCKDKSGQEIQADILFRRAA